MTPKIFEFEPVTTLSNIWLTTLLIC